ncbi:hypothetical protein BW716_33200 [[Flexibacter] sp. ATCC 35208]|nr:hypothetical protein BW716_33200 [[Flexibacter] sp. ATCC 35208]
MGQDASTKITLHVKQAKLQSVVEQVERQVKPALHFIYANDIFNGQKRITLDCDNVPLDDVLKKIEAQSGIYFTHSTKTIMLAARDEKGKDIPVRTVPRKADSLGKINKVTTLGETVVVAYELTTRRIYTGNATPVNSDDISNQPVSNPLLALQGRVPGLFISQTSGMSGTAINVQIRGKNSLMNDTKPLYIIDDIPFNPILRGGLGSVIWGEESNALDFINPSDIESITILKDADATSIYGSRGANGVVLITTKKGKVGKPSLSVDVNYGIEQVPRYNHLLNTQQYLAMRREAFKNDDVPAVERNAPDLEVWDTTRYTDWQKELIGHAAGIMNVHASVLGGIGLMQYLISGSYQKRGTVFPGSFNTQKSNVYFNSTAISPNKKFQVGITGTYATTQSFLPGADMSNATTLAPDAPPIYNPDGSLNFSYVNPLIALIGPLFNANVKNLYGNVKIQYEILPRLWLKASFGDYLLEGNSQTTTPISTRPPSLRDSATGSATSYQYDATSRIFEPQINYDNYLWNSKFSIILGATLQGYSENRQAIYATGFKEDAFLGNLAFAGNITGTSDKTDYRYAALFGRIGYQLCSRYLLNLNVRRDGSSRFGSKKQYANFGSVGVGWIFSEERFTSFAANVVSFGKLRMSYGIAGNDQIGDYNYLEQYERVGGSYQGVIGYQPSSLANQEYAWEQTRKFEVGLELGFLKDKISLTTSHYRYRSSNQLVNYSLPELTGAGSTKGNIPAVVRNTGWEWMAHVNNIGNNRFGWSAMVNVTLPFNKLVSYPGQVPADLGIVGKPLTQLMMYRAMGTDPNTGAYLFDDGTGHGAPASENLKRVVPVNLAPKLYGGIENTFRYKSWEVDIFFQFVQQQGMKDIFDPTYMPGYQRNQNVAVLNRWQEKGQVSDWQRFTQTSTLRKGYMKALESNLHYGDASYVRCKTLSISKKILFKNLQVKDAKLYVQAENLFTITSYEGLDPETQSHTVLPVLRTIRAGVTITL